MKDNVKTYTCKVCKEKYDLLASVYARRSLSPHGQLKSCCLKKDCEIESKSKAAMKYIENKKKKERKDWAIRKQEIKESLGIVKKQSQEPLQKSINKIVRLIDAEQPCIARPLENHFHFDAGHVFSVGSYPNLRYNFNNIFKQSVKSNRDLGGEPDLMLEGIETLYGSEQLGKTLKLKQLGKLGLSNQEKKEALKIANRIIREIEKHGTVYSRDELNFILKIY